MDECEGMKDREKEMGNGGRRAIKRAKIIGALRTHEKQWRCAFPLRM